MRANYTSNDDPVKERERIETEDIARGHKNFTKKLTCTNTLR